MTKRHLMKEVKRWSDAQLRTTLGQMELSLRFTGSRSGIKTTMRMIEVIEQELAIRDKRTKRYFQS